METELLDLLNKRYAWRAISPRPVEEEKLEAILNAGASSVGVDGQKVTYDLKAVRRPVLFRAGGGGSMSAGAGSSSVRMPGAIGVFVRSSGMWVTGANGPTSLATKAWVCNGLGLRLS